MTTELVELADCPGCGGNDTRVIGGPGTRGGPQYWAGCDHCRWRTWGDTEAEAITAWNTRALASRAGGPDGFVLVPERPTQEMLDAYTRLDYNSLVEFNYYGGMTGWDITVTEDGAKTAWEAMLAAAPEPGAVGSKDNDGG